MLTSRYSSLHMKKAVRTFLSNEIMANSADYIPRFRKLPLRIYKKYKNGHLTTISHEKAQKTQSLYMTDC